MIKTSLLLLPVFLIGGSFALAPVPEAALPQAGLETERADLASETVFPGSLRADVDRDGRLDLFLIHPSGAATLYLSIGGTLEERPSAFGPEGLPRVRSAAFGDLDADGAPDLFVVTREGRARLFVGDGAGMFTDVTASAGLLLDGTVLAGRWVDVDEDGRADLVLATATGFSIAHNLGDGYVEVQQLAHSVTPVFAPSAPVVSPVAESELEPPTVATEGEPRDVSTSRAPGTGGRRPVPSPTGSRAEFSAPIPETIGSVTPLAVAGGPCAMSLKDALNGGCIKGSTTPTLGMFFPLSTSLNVNSVTDRVGIGTTSPGAKLEVQTTGETALRAFTDFGSAAYIRSTSTTSPALTAEGGSNDRAGVFLGSLEVGYRLVGMFPIPVSRVFLDTSQSGGRLRFHNSDSLETVLLVAEDGPDNGAELILREDDGTSTIQLDAQRSSVGPELAMFTSAGVETIELLAEEASGNGAQLVLRKANGVATMILDAETGTAGVFAMRSQNGTETVQIVAEEASGDGAQIVLKKADGTVGITLDAEQGADSRITTEVLEITGGADIVEGFGTGGSHCAPGSVVVIDDTRPGELRLSDRAYDARVAGVVSGAGGVKPGLSMGQNGALDGETKVALSGRVYVRCTTENGPVRAGDLLTTSSTPGFAMRATDRDRSFGAVIGKAMGALTGGEGLVLVLVNLQ